ncbi:hypothetical protein Cantr_07862 [Candida viswanathii]|uniref:37S ribosomal protein MRP21, mitochondrial n=1 Tax=Candida viswanathii TaxID=5486 RepID=A0A367Y0C8_9ASCO|nr:hypothetical protein Cantr_07862 [Candida viswanathii]
MFRSVLGRNLIPRVLTCQPSPQIVRTTFVRFISESNSKKSDEKGLKGLKNLMGDSTARSKSTNPQRTKQSPSSKPAFDIDTLLKTSIPDKKQTLSNSVSTAFPSSFSLNEKFEFQEEGAPTPRDVARNMRVFGSVSGRSITVRSRNLPVAFNLLNSTLTENRIKYLQKVQSRFTPPAKHRKNVRNARWRIHFKTKFKEMLGEVFDARRRGY